MQIRLWCVLQSNCVKENGFVYRILLDLNDDLMLVSLPFHLASTLRMATVEAFPYTLPFLLLSSDFLRRRRRASPMSWRPCSLSLNPQNQSSAHYRWGLCMHLLGLFPIMSHLNVSVLHLCQFALFCVYLCLRLPASIFFCACTPLERRWWLCRGWLLGFLRFVCAGLTGNYTKVLTGRVLICYDQLHLLSVSTEPVPSWSVNDCSVWIRSFQIFGQGG